MRSEFLAVQDFIDLSNVEPNELVRRVQSGCSDSATELFNRFTPRLLILLERRLSGRRTDAEDIAQEAMSRAFHNLHRFDFSYQFSTWLYTIAFRLSVDLVRKEKLRPNSIPIEMLASEPASNDSHASQADSDNNIWPLARSLLVESQFTILWLKYSEGLSIPEIASVLRKTQIGVRVQLHRGRTKLAKELSRKSYSS